VKEKGISLRSLKKVAALENVSDTGALIGLGKKLEKISTF